MMDFIRRLGWRLFWSVLATVAAFALFQPLARLTGVPEVVAVLPVLAVVYWVEMSFTVMRVMLCPALDFQQIARTAAAREPSGATAVALILAVGNLVRLGMVLWIVYGLR